MGSVGVAVLSFLSFAYPGEPAQEAARKATWKAVKRADISSETLVLEGRTREKLKCQEHAGTLEFGPDLVLRLSCSPRPTVVSGGGTVLATHEQDEGVTNREVSTLFFASSGDIVRASTTYHYCHDPRLCPSPQGECSISQAFYRYSKNKRKFEETPFRYRGTVPSPVIEAPAAYLAHCRR